MLSENSQKISENLKIQSNIGKSRLSSAFKKPAFVAYTVAGDPSFEASIEAAKALIDGGCTVLELGVPFSDPVADGDVIQRADNRAIRAGIKTGDVFRLVKEIRKFSEIPIVFLVYFNIVYQRGQGNFYREAKEAGVDGILIVDLPPEEAGFACELSRKYGIDQIFLVTPTTSDERLDMIAGLASGFIYLVSSLGVTGVRKNISTDAFLVLNRIKERTDIPVAIGFGISKPEHAAKIIRSGANGVIVGSYIVSVIEKNLNNPDIMCDELRLFTKMMIKGIAGEQI
ncbi:tryptophan synthase subunit alpha [Methanoplanus sp. FWC-SCC4]|uniref:Tryptophan synthase alpha chain n=1 Tax=Methanochimaera problematica TaxID=2609417 RepID=A0AA97I4E8_9EURY|nr:tryptophan synthase subunit alpha [Methanoplanus sp. FWC-SCC4]WOF16439.1 tryptophan synthase subunit alpha [Methanoplanus sp. FWC-SCC4]